MESKRLTWARRLMALAQNGLTYTADLPELSLTKVTPGQLTDMFVWHNGRRHAVYID